MRKLIIPLFCLLLTACAEHIAERNGTEIQIVPVTYAIDVEIKANKTTKAWQELNSYAEKHWDILTTQSVNIYWKSKQGKALADKFAEHLLSQGVDNKKLHVLPLNEDSNSNFAHDLRLETVVNRVVTNTCGYEMIGNFGREANGCYAEGARWQSMVNPEKMIRAE